MIVIILKPWSDQLKVTLATKFISASWWHSTLVKPVRLARDLGIYIYVHINAWWCWVFADLCPANGFAVFRRPPPAVLDPSLSADRHVPDTGGQPCANSFGLWQQCPWPSGLLGPTTPVSAERGCAVDLSPAAIRPHLRRAGLPPLAACPWGNRVHSRSLYWHIKSSTDLRRCTSAFSHVSPTYPVADRCVLSAPVAC